MTTVELMASDKVMQLASMHLGILNNQQHLMWCVMTVQACIWSAASIAVGAHITLVTSHDSHVHQALLA